MINNVTAKYADLRKGIYDTHYEVNGTQPQQTNSTEPPKQAISLIDFDDDLPAYDVPAGQGKKPATMTSNGNLMDELDGLFGPSTTTAPATSQPTDLFDLTSPMGGLSLNAPPKIPQQLAPASPNARSISSNASHSPSLLPDSSFGSPMTSTVTSSTANVPPPQLAIPGSAENCKFPLSSSLESVCTWRAHNLYYLHLAAPITFLEKNGLKIVFVPSYSDGVTHYEALFSNTSTAPMDQIMFQLAAPKVRCNYNTVCCNDFANYAF